MRRPDRYWVIVRETQGNGPWLCHECGELVEFRPVRRETAGDERRIAPVVHHLDEDEDNNSSENLVVMHHVCHSKLHRRNSGTHPQSIEARRKISEALRGRIMSEGAREKLRSRVWTDESRQKLSDAKAGRLPPNYVEFQRASNRRFRCLECLIVTSAGPLARHQAATNHSGREAM